MSRLADLGRAAHEELSTRHDAREIALRAARESIRCSAAAIRAAHRGQVDGAAEGLHAAGDRLRAAEAACEGLPMVRWAGFVGDAQKEFAEASCTLAVLSGDRLPSAEDLGVDVAAWLNGLAEAVGELRRAVLDQLRHVDQPGSMGRCESLLQVMDDIYSVLVTIDQPDGITEGLRRSTDIARGILERTRGDFTTARLQERLRSALAERSDPV